MTDEITQNDCQGENEFMAYYSKLSALEAKLFKAIGIAFQLKDFGHNVIDEIDGECFEQDVGQMDRFTAANKAALAAAMSIVNPDLERLKAELTEAREVVIDECIQSVAQSSWKHEGDDAYSKGMDQGARHQVDACIEALEGLKGETDDA